MEQRTDQKLSDDHHDKSAHHRKGKRGVDGRTNLFLISAAGVLGDDDIRAESDADEQVDQKTYNRCVAADRRHGLFADELTDDRHIRRIEQLLQDAGQRQRQRKEKDLAAQRSMDHIYGMFIFPCFAHRFLSVSVPYKCRLFAAYH